MVALLGLIYAASTWDRRSEWIRYVETGLEREHPFAALIPEDAQVYWHENLAATWLVLRRPSYVSDYQGAGNLFNRKTAIEHMRRHNQFAPLEFQVNLCSTIYLLNGEKEMPTDCLPTDELVEELCRLERGPDFMIFERRLPRGVVASWTFNPGADTARIFHLYDCRQFR